MLDEANKNIKEKTIIEEQKSEEIFSIQEACEKRVQEAKEKTNKIFEEAKEKVKQYEVLLFLIFRLILLVYRRKY